MSDETLHTGLFIDANLLVLLAAGRTDPRLIAKHKRLTEFTSDDYERLTESIIALPDGRIQRSRGNGQCFSTAALLDDASPYPTIVEITMDRDL